MVRWLVVSLLFLPALAPGQPDWPYETGFDESLLHVHPVLNYAQHPEWLDNWERDRLGPGAFLGTFGSSATDELLVDAQWTLNPELTGGGLRFRNDIDWREQRHLPTEYLDIWLGLEQRVHGPFAVLAQATVAEAKETIDLRAGLLWTSSDRTRYVQLLYVAEDIVRDKKDDLEPETRRSSQGLDWLLRLERGPWSLFSRGHWASDYVRDYPRETASPELLRHEKTANELEVRVRWLPASRTQLELSWRQVEDAEAMVFRGDLTSHDYDFSGWYRVVGTRGLLPLSSRWRLRGELNRLDRRASAGGWRAFEYHRDETLPGLWAEWRFGGRHWMELGYLGSVYRWQYAGEDEQTGYADKLELGAVFGFVGGAGLKVSLSHEVSLERFGGASVRMITQF